MAKKGHTQMQWEAKFFECGCACIYCGEPLTLARASKDHLVPRSRGGTDAISNIAPCCFPCNLRKGRRTFKEFAKTRATFSAVSEKFTALPIPTTSKVVEEKKSTANFELIDRPFLLEKIAKEEQSVSWAWRNPA